MSDTLLDRRIAAVRRFNRFYTPRIGVLDEAYLATPFSLAEGRVLYELAQGGAASAAQLARGLGLDPGYLSRILRGFRRRGLIDRRAAPGDRRQRLISLNAAGRTAFAPLDDGAKAAIGEMLGPLDGAAQGRLVAAMARIAALLGDAPPALVVLRPHRPGDLGWVTARHGAIYAEEFGWDATFEAMVAEIAAGFLRGFDARCEACWIAEADGEPIGAVALVREADAVGRLRLLLVETAARGRGIGARLVGECLDFAARAGYRRVVLSTYSVLAAARRIYEAAGFRLAERHEERAFGRDLTGETWEIAL